MPSEFLNSVKHVIRCKHYSIKTEHTYVYWIKYYIRYHKYAHPKDLGDSELSGTPTIIIFINLGLTPSLECPPKPPTPATSIGIFISRTSEAWTAEAERYRDVPERAEK